MSLFSAVINEDVLGRSAQPDPASIVQVPPVAKREVFIAIRRDGIKGDGTKENPYNGSDRDTLDAVLNGIFDTTLQAPVRFVFGPGIFRTAGSWRNSEGLNPPAPRIWFGVFPGQEFIGAGMFATTLRLELPIPLENASYGVFGVAPNVRADGVIIENLTIDCDMQNQPPTPPHNYPRLMVLGIGFLGDDIRVKRVRVINAGEPHARLRI